jgi:allantoinase
VADSAHNGNEAFDLVIRGGVVVAPDRRTRADIGIRAGRVAAVGHSLPAGKQAVDARGLLVLPGLVDGHVHFREPGMESKEDFGTGSRAAAAGGVTTVIDMPNTIPPVATVEGFNQKLALVSPKAHVDFGLYGMLGQSNAGQIGAMAAAGAMGLKLFMGQTTGDNPCPDDGAIHAGLRAAAAAGLVVGAHAENNPLLQQFGRELRSAGRHDPRAHLDSRPDLVEVEAVTRIVTLAAATGTQIHIHHLSSAAGLARVRLLRSLGYRVSAEVLVGHLSLNDDAYEKHGNLVKLNPPIRPQADVAALWEGVRRGDVDLIATDHAPHTAQEQAEADVWHAHGGWIGVETMLPLLLTQASDGRLSVSDIVRLCSYNPARRWGIDDRKGHLGVGSDADFVLVDENQPGQIRAGRLHSKHPVTPYDGWPTVGSVRATYLRGALVAQDGEPVGPPTGLQVRPRRAPAGSAEPEPALAAGPAA